MTFTNKLLSAVLGKPGLCVGLDPIPEKIPKEIAGDKNRLLTFNRAIIDATAEYAVAYKPNLAFYERFGASGWDQLAETIESIPKGKIVILDAKRGDIGSTSEAYADAMFGNLKGTAMTVSPYLGSDSISPFLSNPECGVFLLCLTSNPGGSDLQLLVSEGRPIYQHIISLAKKLNNNNNIGLVVGATKVEFWADILKSAVDLPLLIPGVGAQGGSISELKVALEGYNGPALVNSSRAIIHASSDKDFAQAANNAAKEHYKQLIA